MKTAPDARPDEFDVATAEDAMHDAQRIFHRTLTSWVSDLLLLRQRGLLGTSWSNERSDDCVWSNAA